MPGVIGWQDTFGEDAGDPPCPAGATGRPSGYVEVVTISRHQQAASHVASRSGALACGNKPRKSATVTHVSDDLTAATCRACRTVLGLDEPAEDLSRLAALFVVAITMGLRPGELRALRWDHVNLDQQVIYVWRSSSRGGDTKTPKSRRTLSLPQRAATALRAHEKRQSTERETAGDHWQEHGLVFCREDGTPYTKDALNWQFGKITRRAGIGHRHAHESRHTAVSIMSNNGVPTQDISDAMGHKSTHVTDTIYRHVIAPAIRGGAEIMDDVFGDVEEDSA